MPELPEVETVVRGLRPHLLGRRLLSVTQRRADLREPLPADFVARLTGRRVDGVERRAKYILMTLDDEQVLVVHLGMSGRLVLVDRTRNSVGPHDHVEFEAEGAVRVCFSDPRRFGLIDLVPGAALAQHARFRALGPEPLSPDFTPAALGLALEGRHTAIKTALLDQRTVAGIGNIYACEALYRAGISPRRLAATVRGDRLVRLVAAVKSVLTDAIAAGGSSARDYVQASGELGWFQHRWAVYDREGRPCPGCDCGAGVRRLVQGGRSTFYCAKRQR